MKTKIFIPKTRHLNGLFAPHYDCVEELIFDIMITNIEREMNQHLH